MRPVRAAKKCELVSNTTRKSADYSDSCRTSELPFVSKTPTPTHGSNYLASSSSASPHSFLQYFYLTLSRDEPTSTTCDPTSSTSPPSPQASDCQQETISHLLFRGCSLRAAPSARKFPMSCLLTYCTQHSHHHNHKSYVPYLHILPLHQRRQP